MVELQVMEKCSDGIALFEARAEAEYEGDGHVLSIYCYLMYDALLS